MHKRTDVEIGMALMTVTMLMVPGLDAIAKVLTETLAPGQVAWGRFLFQTAVILPLMLLTGRSVRTTQPGVQAARGLLLGEGLDIPVLDPVHPDRRDWLLLVALGLLSAIGHVMLAFAFRYAAAGILAPFQYLEIISATILGVIVFGELPDAITWLGTALIIGSGLYVFLRERKLARTA